MAQGLRDCFGVDFRFGPLWYSQRCAHRGQQKGRPTATGSPPELLVDTNITTTRLQCDGHKKQQTLLACEKSPNNPHPPWLKKQRQTCHRRKPKYDQASQTKSSSAGDRQPRIFTTGATIGPKALHETNAPLRALYSHSNAAKTSCKHPPVVLCSDFSLKPPELHLQMAQVRHDFA